MDDNGVLYAGALIFLLFSGLFFFEYLEEEKNVAKHGSRFTMSLERGELAWEEVSNFLKQGGPYVLSFRKGSKFSEKKGTVNGCTYTVTQHIKKDQVEFTVIRSGECSGKVLSKLMQSI